MLLSQLVKGHLARITAISHATEAVAARLKKLGLEEGATVEVIHWGFPSKDPIAVRVDDHMVALGKREADAIQVQAIT